MHQIAVVFLWLMIYSFIGWAYESTLCSITGHKLVNRGFLNGPLCPVYGFGALLIIFTLQNIADQNLISLFLSSAVLTCTLEYLTSWVLEKLFHAKWWDYSHYRFQLNGRVCLLGAAAFGALSVLLLKWIHPFISGLVNSLPIFWLYLISGVLFVLFASDCFFTVKSILTLNHKLEEIQRAINLEKEKSKLRLASMKEEIIETIDEKSRGLRETLAQQKQRLMERFEASEFYTEHIKTLLAQNKFSEKRLLKAFPHMRSASNNEALEQLREKLRKLKK